MRWVILAGLVLLAGCGDVPELNQGRGAETAPREPFFAIASGKSVVRCAAAAKAFDTNRRVEQALKVDEACQADMNTTDLSPDCREYAVAVWTASGKFQGMMEAEPGHGVLLGDALRYHRERAAKAAPSCTT